MERPFKIFRPLVIAAIGGGMSVSAWSGAWVPEEGQGYFKAGYAYYDASDFFGGSQENTDFTGKNTSFYGEYGLGHNLAIYGTLLHQDIEQTTSDGRTTTSSGFGDAELGVRYQWQASPFVVSTSFLMKLPYLYDEDDELPRGNGQEDYELKVLIGKSLNEYGYFGVEAGYRYRTDAPSDEYRYLLEYGFSANENLYFRTKLDGILSANNSDVITGSNSINLSATPEYDLGKWELTAGWNFGPAGDRSDGRWGVELTYTKDAFGDQTLDGDSWQLGLTRVF